MKAPDLGDALDAVDALPLPEGQAGLALTDAPEPGFGAYLLALTGHCASARLTASRMLRAAPPTRGTQTVDPGA